MKEDCINSFLIHSSETGPCMMMAIQTMMIAREVYFLQLISTTMQLPDKYHLFTSKQIPHWQLDKPCQQLPSENQICHAVSETVQNSILDQTGKKMCFLIR